MRESQLFTRALHTPPKDEVALNARMLTRAGFVYKHAAGVYSFLPLGWRVIEKISSIIRKEMDAIGGQEMLMPTLVAREYLETSGRWDVPIGFEVKGKAERAAHFVLGWTHEEVLTEIAAKYISSYRDLPCAAYQIQAKFRNEPRAKSGLLRGREFIMKDLYSFHADEEDFTKYYETVSASYERIFRRCGLAAIRTEAAGGDFTSDATREFQVIAPSGEDTILVCDGCPFAENKEIAKRKAGAPCPKCRGTVREEKAIEVGNIFPLGTRYSRVFHLQFLDRDSARKDVVMGSYGIGIGRTMGAIVETHHDARGIVWPESVAPFRVHLLELDPGRGAEFYRALQKEHCEVLFDDRSVSPGEKLVEADLIGIPWRIVASRRAGDKIEVKRRGEEKPEIMSIGNFIKKLER